MRIVFFHDKFGPFWRLAEPIWQPFRTDIATYGNLSGAVFMVLLCEKVSSFSFDSFIFRYFVGA